MDPHQPWSYPNPSDPSHTAVSQEESEEPQTEQTLPVDDRNPYLWFPQTPWDMNNPAFVSLPRSLQITFFKSGVFANILQTSY